MTGRSPLVRARHAARRFLADESGANLVEFALVVSLFLFLLFAIIDFGRIGHTWVAANKATQLAARLAAVRPPACSGVPTMNLRGSTASPPAFGALCRSGANVCAVPATVTCDGSAANATALEIFNAVRPLVPAGTTIGQMQYTYAFDPNLGFLGGPYVPMVTVEFTDVNFTFVSQLGAFIGAMTGRASSLGTALAMPGMSVSLPGEDLALGTEG
jgi:Flp pilus assembly protein TadG